MRITDGLARGTVICGDAETPNAKSSRKMYFSRGESCRHVTEIIDKGLKIPLVINSFDKKLMLIDDNDFPKKQSNVFLNTEIRSEFRLPLIWASAMTSTILIWAIIS